MSSNKFLFLSNPEEFDIEHLAALTVLIEHFIETGDYDRAKRPPLLNSCTRGFISQALWPDIEDWLRKQNIEWERKIDLSSLHQEFRSAIDQVEGYAVARKLERMNWRPNAELVKILGRIEAALYFAYDALLDRWVEEVGMKMPVGPGDHIVFNVQGSKGENVSVHGLVSDIFPSKGLIVALVDLPGTDEEETRLVGVEDLVGRLNDFNKADSKTI